MIAVMIWGNKWRGYTVLVYCDNEAIVAILTSRFCKKPHLMHMLQVLFFAEAHYQFKLHPNTFQAPRGRSRGGHRGQMTPPWPSGLIVK